MRAFVVRAHAVAVAALPRVAPSRMLLQYARDDFFTPLSVARAMHAAAGPDARLRTYVVDHSLEVSAALRDRDAFLHRTLQP
jgi:hypothetical protein